jgi:hypothetical protein
VVTYFAINWHLGLATRMGAGPIGGLVTSLPALSFSPETRRMELVAAVILA